MPKSDAKRVCVCVCVCVCCVCCVCVCVCVCACVLVYQRLDAQKRQWEDKILPMSLACLANANSWRIYRRGMVRVPVQVLKVIVRVNMQRVTLPVKCLIGNCLDLAVRSEQVH